VTRFPIVHRRQVAPDWLDSDGRMAPFAFNLAFSRATDDFFALFGLTPAYRDETLCTIYTLEARTHFLKGCPGGVSIHVDCRLIDLDAKRTHLLLTMYGDDTAEELARQDSLIMHMRREPGSAPVGAPFPPAMFAGLSATLIDHRDRVLRPD
jgi:acyl-CoA thioester hydrolase